MSKEVQIAWLDSINLEQYPPENYPVVAMVNEYRKHLADIMRDNETLKENSRNWSEQYEELNRENERLQGTLKEIRNHVYCNRLIRGIAEQALANRHLETVQPGDTGNHVDNQSSWPVTVYGKPTQYPAIPTRTIHHKNGCSLRDCDCPSTVS